MNHALLRLAALGLGLGAAVNLPAIEAGEPAPDFTLPGLDGSSSLTLSEHRGQHVLVTFWTSWSGPSQVAAEEEIGPLAQVLASQENWLALSIGLPWSGDTREAQRGFVEAHHLSGTFLFDESGAVAEDYGVRIPPTTVAIGPDGNVLAAGHTGVALQFAQAIDPTIRSLVPRRTDLAASAQPIALGAPVQASVARDGEAIFAFTPAAASAEYTATTAGNGFDTVIQAYDAQGNMIAENDDLGGGTVDSQINVSAQSGAPTYFLVHGFNGAAGDFSLTVVPSE